MNKILIASVVILSLAGCQSNVVVRKEPYPVYTTIPTTQRPPVVPKCELKVDQLTATSDAGTVAMAYKHDTECLRGKLAQYELILKQYSEAADEADRVGVEIKKQFQTVIDKYHQDILATEKQAAEKGISIQTESSQKP